MNMLSFFDDDNDDGNDDDNGGEGRAECVCELRIECNTYYTILKNFVLLLVTLCTWRNCVVDFWELRNIRLTIPDEELYSSTHYESDIYLMTFCSCISVIYVLQM